jgi:GcrA cell cycle regulator
MSIIWTEGTIRTLRDEWGKGTATSEIGRKLGVSKNSIVGKAHRLDLDARPSPIRRKGAPKLPPLPLRLSVRSYSLPPLSSAIITMPVVLVPPPPVSTPTPVRRISPSCCWPIGEPRSKTFRFCDNGAITGKSYCEEHAKLAFIKVRELPRARSARL